MEGLIIFAIVGLAAVYIGISFYKKFNPAKTTGSCDGGCSCCAMNKTSASIQKQKKNYDCL